MFIEDLQCSCCHCFTVYGIKIPGIYITRIRNTKMRISDNNTNNETILMNSAECESIYNIKQTEPVI
jgi:hypothetical protein